MRVQNLVLVAALLALAGAEGARADNLYFAVLNPNTTCKFGTVDAAGHATTIATGLNYGTGGVTEKLMFAPDGTLYGFDVSYAGYGNGAWGRINPATGAFTQIGSLNTVFGNGLDHNENYGFSLAFSPSGTLYATGYNQSDSRWDYGTLDLTTGAFTKVSNSPLGQAEPGSIATWGNTTYFAVLNPNTTCKFGTVDAAGHATTIATGLNYGTGGVAEKLMFAPDGTLYGFDVSYAGYGNGAWGRINPATGAFTQIGSLNTVFGVGLDHNEDYGYSFAFGSSGTLYATGYNPSDSKWDYGTLDLTTGAFTKISISPLGQAEPGSIAAPIPEPSTVVLLARQLSPFWLRVASAQKPPEYNGREVMRIQNLILAAALFALAAMDRVQADSLYFAAMNPNATYKFGTVDAAATRRRLPRASITAPAARRKS